MLTLSILVCITIYYISFYNSINIYISIYIYIIYNIIYIILYIHIVMYNSNYTIFILYYITTPIIFRKARMKSPLQPEKLFGVEHPPFWRHFALEISWDQEWFWHSRGWCSQRLSFGHSSQCLCPIQDTFRNMREGHVCMTLWTIYINSYITLDLNLII